MRLVAIHAKTADPLAFLIVHLIGAEDSSDRRPGPFGVNVTTIPVPAIRNSFGASMMMMPPRGALGGRAFAMPAASLPACPARS
jgi:hypothetical protein